MEFSKGQEVYISDPKCLFEVIDQQGEFVRIKPGAYGHDSMTIEASRLTPKGKTRDRTGAIL